MDFATVSELRNQSGAVWKKVAAGEEIVVMRRGKPIALLVRTKPAEVEETVRALRATAHHTADMRLLRTANRHGPVESASLTEANEMTNRKPARRRSSR